MDTLHDRFEKHSDLFLKSEKSDMPRDLSAMNLLQKIAPVDHRIISASEHDEIFFGTNSAKFAENATDADIEKLVRLGVRYSREYDCFCMFT